MKGIADSDSDDDAEKWIQRQKSKVEVTLRLWKLELREVANKNILIFFFIII